MSGGRGPLPRLHVVTTDEVAGAAGFLDAATEVFEAGGPRVALHLRHRTADARLYRQAEELGRVAGETRSLLLISRRADIALAAGADGVQLGTGALPAGHVRALLGPAAWLGVSIHGAEEAPAAGGAADYAMLGAVYATPSHTGRTPLGAEELRRVARRTALPVIAIGGIGSRRVAACLRAGAYGVAVVRAAWATPRPGRAVEELLESLEDAVP
ncbi:MAG TPA: thiamine phosphate synthase [Longimicrobiales bacterium]|nr:thiamine phosphate synthase [Longimicrobiales bacterium]